MSVCATCCTNLLPFISPKELSVYMLYNIEVIFMIFYVLKLDLKCTVLSESVQNQHVVSVQNYFGI
jgi:hypothetical protein